MTAAQRSAWQITWSVWHAMFMREVLARTMVNRLSWFWMLAEPIAYVVIMVWIRDVIGRGRFIVGAEYIPWLIVGLAPFFLFREGVTRSLGAVKSNQGLFAYRQVKPVDPVLIRNVLEGLLKIVVFVILLVGGGLLGYDLFPADVLGVINAWMALWLLGLGGGLIASVGATLYDSVDMAVRLSMLPMFFLSGAILPLHLLPHGVQELLLLNPVLHGIENVRLSFFEGYRTLGGIDLAYLWTWNLVLLALGLALHLKFALQLKAQ